MQILRSSQLHQTPRELASTHIYFDRIPESSLVISTLWFFSQESRTLSSLEPCELPCGLKGNDKMWVPSCDGTWLGVWGQGLSKETSLMDIITIATIRLTHLKPSEVGTWVKKVLSVSFETLVLAMPETLLTTQLSWLSWLTFLHLQLEAFLKNKILLPMSPLNIFTRFFFKISQTKNCEPFIKEAARKGS